MKFTLPADIVEATRLTRAGKLGEATALLRRRFTPSPSTGDPSTPATPSRAHSPSALLRSADGIDLEPLGLKPAVTTRQNDEGGRFLTASYANQAGSRTYKLYVPGSYDDQPLPLIVMLHGCTQSVDDFARGTGMNSVAEEQSFLVVYPAQSPTANGSKCWNWFDHNNQRRGEGEPSLIAGIVQHVSTTHRVDRKRVYIAGLSAGGATAANLAATYPDVFAAVGVHSGLPRGAAKDLGSAFVAMQRGSAAGVDVARNGRDATARFVPTIVFHGDKDTTVNPANGDHIITHARATAAQQLSAETRHGRVDGGHAYSRTVYTDAAGQPVIERWVINNAAHAWSGGNAAGSFTDPLGPDASRTFARFFLEHSLP
jgi:poly(hydroxyalkanoate) depolymerase family esterase